MFTTHLMNREQRKSFEPWLGYVLFFWYCLMPLPERLGFPYVDLNSCVFLALCGFMMFYGVFSLKPRNPCIVHWRRLRPWLTHRMCRKPPWPRRTTTRAPRACSCKHSAAWRGFVVSTRPGELVEAGRFLKGNDWLAGPLEQNSKLSEENPWAAAGVVF